MVDSYSIYLKSEELNLNTMNNVLIEEINKIINFYILLILKL